MSVTNRMLGVVDTTFIRSVDVQLNFLISMVSSMAAVASPALPSTGTDLGVIDARTGSVFTAVTLPAIFGLSVVGAIADLYGRTAGATGRSLVVSICHRTSFRRLQWIELEDGIDHPHRLGARLRARSCLGSD